MEQQPVFKTSLLGGFDRQSVLNYVFELNNNAKAAQERLEAQIDEVGAAREKLSETVHALEQQLKSIKKTNESLSTELSGEKTKNSEQCSMLESLGREISRQNDIIAEKDAEIKRYAQIKEDLENKNTELENGRNEIEKASIYIGEMTVRARLDAESILEEANLQAKIVLEDADQQAQTLLNDAGEQAQNIKKEAVVELDTMFEQFGRFRAEMRLIEEKVEDAVGVMQKKFAAIGEAIAESEENIRNFYRPCKITLLTDLPKPATDTEELDDSFFRTAAD